MGTNGKDIQGEIESRIRLFKGMVQCCYPVEFWEYDSGFSLLTPVTTENELMTYFFRYNAAFSVLKKYLEEGNTLPVMIHSKDELYWTVDFVTDGKELKRIFVLGPVAVDESAKKKIRQNFQVADHPLDVYRKLTEALNHIPMIPVTYMFQYTIMMHYALTGERVSVSDIQRPYTGQKSKDIFEDEEDNEIDPLLRHIGVWKIERELMQAVKTGNMDYRSILDEASITSKGVKTRDEGSLRSGKNSVILFVGLCSRAAIEGGLPPEIAYDMCDKYVEMTESAVSVPEVIHASDLMLDDYIRKVHSYQEDNTLSKPIRICCDYIHMHVTEDLTFKKLAGVCGYSEYYLSRKFKKETGMALGDYILRAKLDQSCILLRTTAYSVQDISDSLSFSSRSYFSTAFQKYIGISPKAYREGSGREK